MRPLWLAGLWLACLAGVQALGPPRAAGQVVIEERVELTAPDTSATEPSEKASSTETPPFVYGTVCVCVGALVARIYGQPVFFAR